LAAVPALAVVGASVSANESTVKIVGVSAGAIALAVCGLVRDRGRDLETRLWTNWDGNPAVHRLRWRSAVDHDVVHRLHARLRDVLDEPLPDAAAEAADPCAADRRYNEAITVLRERTRDRKRFPLVFAENVEYGFRRNSLGLRSLALAIAVTAFAVSAALVGWGADIDDVKRWGVVATLSAAALVYWSRVVTPQWVRKAAERYADRLIAAIDTLRIPGGNAIG
jgi:hypothetical protein